MAIIRRTGAVAVAALLAMGFPVSAQAATTGVISPANGSLITSGSQITASAHYDLGVSMKLVYGGPGVAEKEIARKSGLWGDLTGPISITRNGMYTVTLKGAVTGGTYGRSVSFQVRIPPAVPSGVAARVAGGKLMVKWNRGSEDDLSGYVLSGSGVSGKSGSVGSLCSGRSCSAGLTLTRSSGPVSVGVQAQRPDGRGGSVPSGTSTASAVVGGGGTGSGSLPPGSAPALPSGNKGVNAAAPLTPFNNESPVTLPSVQPDGATPGFTYPTPQVADTPKAQHVAATDRLQWGRSIGIALVLLIAAAHLGTWTRRLRVAQAGASSAGMAARIARGGSGRKRVRAAREGIARAEALAKTGPVKAEAAAPPRPSGHRPAAAGAKPEGPRVRVADPAAKEPEEKPSTG